MKLSHKSATQIRKSDPPFSCLKGTHLTKNNKHHFGVQGWKFVSKFMELKDKKESDKIDLKAKLV